MLNPIDFVQRIIEDIRIWADTTPWRTWLVTHPAVVTIGNLLGAALTAVLYFGAGLPPLLAATGLALGFGGGIYFYANRELWPTTGDFWIALQTDPTAWMDLLDAVLDFIVPLAVSVAEVYGLGLLFLEVL